MGIINTADPVVGNSWLLAGSNAAMVALDRAVNDIAPTNIPILLFGESGVGKKFIAQRIHQLSPWRNEPFTRVVCATLSADLVSSYFRRAQGNGSSHKHGSVLFDEISELSGASQQMLLYALPEDENPAGLFHGPRVLSSTSHNLEDEMRAGRFRRELYYRINGACLRVPPLRQRKEDIPALVELFLAKHSALLQRAQPPVNPHVMDVLCEYPWPGNIRELENLIKKAIALGDVQMALADLAARPADPNPALSRTQGSPLKMAARVASRQAERQLILEALARTRWNRKRAAQELQISYKSLLHKLKQIAGEEIV